MERNILLTIEYDGSGFSGWQRQPQARTVQGVLEEALSRICGQAVTVSGTSRTDAGVHALGQRATLRGDFGIPTDRIPVAVNNLLSGAMRVRSAVGDVRVVAAEEREPDFHARFSARGKTYRYVIDNSAEPHVFRRNYCYQIFEPLNAEAMREAAKHIVGTHDFACFQAAGGTVRETTVRTVSDIRIWKAERAQCLEAGCAVNTTIDHESKRELCDIVIEIDGDGFLYNMVRIIVGTLAEVGLGKREPQSMVKIIESGQRQMAGHTAPAAGLYLTEVHY